MAMLDVNSDVRQVRTEEEHILASFTRRLIEIVSSPGERGPETSPTATLNAVRLPPIALHRQGCIAGVNAPADAVFDNDIKIKDRRLFIRAPAARTPLKDSIEQLKDLPRGEPPRMNAFVMEPVIVPRMDKLPVILRLWPFEGSSQPPGPDVRALLTMN